MIEHWYIPSPGQANSAERAQVLGLPLADTTKAAAYGNPALPCAICDHDGIVVVTPEPTTFEAVWAAHDALVQRAPGLQRIFAGVPTTAPRAVDLVENQFSVSVNEAGSLLTITVKLSDGTVKSGTVALV